MGLPGTWGKKKPINRALGITPTADVTWTTAPTNLANVTDDDWTTVSGTAQTIMGAAGYFGALQFNLGGIYTAILRAKLGIWAAGATEIRMRWEYSTDGITYIATDNQWAVAYGAAAEIIQYSSLGSVRAQYFRLRFYVAGADTCNVKFYEVQAIEFPEISGRN